MRSRSGQKTSRPPSIELIASGGGEWRWFYKIQFYDKTRMSNATPPDVVNVILLMHGTVVKPSAAVKVVSRQP